ncbi:transcriptional regulator NanR [Algicella marina]|uniref:Transcriptional regulator NanR n=1 Tax=Algicella marina TaxID=2683284 RepID=A0A6P1T476_9RHOB|nr:transcriptional regulator NanR [Algicella marina]QHQ36296.1 transcriptional regulator NanR [Algicella marina]
MPNDAPVKGEEKIVRLKLSEQVLERLREMIRSGELSPGDYMPSERALMERFSVGRPAVREALQALHTQGLITISHGERSKVNELSANLVLDQSDMVANILLDAVPANLEHLKEARRMFELGIVRTAAERATEEDVVTLRKLLAEQESQLTGDLDVRSFIEADMAFHTAIANILANPVVTAASSAMLRWLQEYHTALLHWSGNEQTTLNEHARLIDRIAANDPDGAVDEMRSHLDRSRNMFAPRRAT